MNTFRKNMELRSMKNLIYISLSTPASKSTFLFEKFAIKEKGTVCDILKYGYKLTLYTPPQMLNTAAFI